MVKFPTSCWQAATDRHREEVRHYTHRPKERKGIEVARSLFIYSLFGITLFLCSFLLPLLPFITVQRFKLEPRGETLTWFLSLLILQVVLLVGYLYAHLVSTYLKAPQQTRIHIFASVLVIFLSFSMFAITAEEETSDGSLLSAVWLKMVVVVLPFLAVAANLFLLLNWFSHIRKSTVLWTVTQLGCISSLAVYVALIEPRSPKRGDKFDLHSPTVSRIAIYVVFVILTALCGWSFLRATSTRSVTRKRAHQSGPLQISEASSFEPTRLSLGHRLHWMFLAAVPCTLMLIIATHLTRETATIPILWILPLGTYMLGFQISWLASGRPDWIQRRTLACMPVLVALGTFHLFTCWPAVPVWGDLAFYLVVLFVASVACHGELLKNRPSKEALPVFGGSVIIGVIIGTIFSFLLLQITSYGMLAITLLLVLVSAFSPLINKLKAASLLNRAVDLLSLADMQGKKLDAQVDAILSPARKNASPLEQKARDLRRKANGQAKSLESQAKELRRSAEKADAVGDMVTASMFRAHSVVLDGRAATIRAEAEAQSIPLEQAVASIMSPARISAQPFELQAQCIRSRADSQAHQLEEQAKRIQKEPKAQAGWVKMHGQLRVQSTKLKTHADDMGLRKQVGAALKSSIFWIVTSVSVIVPFIPCFVRVKQVEGAWGTIWYGIPFAIASFYSLFFPGRFVFVFGAMVFLYPLQQKLQFLFYNPGQTLLSSVRVGDKSETRIPFGKARTETVHYRTLFRGNRVLGFEPTRALVKLQEVDKFAKLVKPPAAKIDPDGRRPGFAGKFDENNDQDEFPVNVESIREMLTAYYSKEGPLGDVFKNARDRKNPLNIGVVGLGTGIIAGHADAGDRFTFYESDPVIKKIVWDSTEYFSYLSDARATITMNKRRVPSAGVLDIKFGDVRLELARADQKYDMLIVDPICFEGIPVHLVTKEAFDLYLAKTLEDGVIVFNTTNHSLDLKGVLAKMIESKNMDALFKHDNTANPFFGELASEWVTISRPSQGWICPQLWRSLPPVSRRRPLWTDEFTKQSSFLRQFYRWMQ